MDRLRSPGAVLVAVVVATGLVVPAVGGVATAVGGDESAAAASLTLPSSQTNNSSVRHVDPDAASPNEDTGALRRWLAGRMDKALVDCSQGLEVGDYDACNRTDQQYPEWVEMYAEVTGRSGGANGSGSAPPGSDTNAQSFENARENQTRLAATVKEFRETEEQYREARRNGNDARARELARKLSRLSKRTENTAAALRRNYRRAAANSSANFSGAIASVNEIDRNVTRTASRVSAQSFVDTTLRVTADGETASFLDPLSVSGLLATENGTALANEPVQLEIGNRTINTTTDPYGGFTVPYRPTWLPLDAEQVTVRYVPANDSALLGSSATVPIDPESVTPTVTLTTRSAADPTGTRTTVGYNDTLTVAGSVRAEGIPAKDVPVVVTIGGEPINATWTGTETIRTTNNSTVLTGSDGRFAFTTRLPAGVSPGERQVRVTIPWRNRSLVGANATAPLTVARTATALDATGEQTAGREIRVTGRLRTPDGTPVRGCEVAIRAGGAVLTRTTTTENGSYSTVALVPRDALDQRGTQLEALVTVTYDGSGTNLDSSRTTLEVPIRGLSVTDRWTVLLGTFTDAVTGLSNDFRGALDDLARAIATLSPTVIVLVSAIATLAVSLLVAGVRPRWTRRSSDPEDSANGDGAERDVDSGDEATTTNDTDTPWPFSPADWLFAGQPDEAVETGYAMVRARLGGELGISPSRTHREFYDACRDAAIGDARLAALRALVAAYERAAFAPDSLSERVAGEVLDRLSVFGDEEAAESQDADRNRPGDV